MPPLLRCAIPRRDASLGLVTALARDPAVPAPRVVADSQIGPALLLQSQSHAIGHAFKPVARLGLQLALGRRSTGIPARPHRGEAICDALSDFRLSGGLAGGCRSTLHDR
jgi:hypothetical protein